MKKYKTPITHIIEFVAEDTLKVASGCHDNGQGGFHGNPDKGGWKSKSSTWSEGWEDDGDEF